jgi:hypothetical protein
VTQCSLQTFRKNILISSSGQKISHQEVHGKPEVQGSIFLWSVTEILDYTASHPRDSTVHIHRYENLKSNRNRWINMQLFGRLINETVFQFVCVIVFLMLVTFQCSISFSKQGNKENTSRTVDNGGYCVTGKLVTYSDHVIFRDTLLWLRGAVHVFLMEKTLNIWKILMGKIF